MDLEFLIPVFGIVFVIGPFSALALSYTPLGRAIVKRLGRGGATHASEDRLLELQDEVQRLQERLGDQDERFEELHDRLDFAERLLARGPAVEDESARVVTPV